MAERKAAKLARQLSAENSFAAVARLWWDNWKQSRSSSHVVYVMRRLEADIFPAIGARPIDQIEAPELVKMGQVFRYAIAHGMAKRNPIKDFQPGDVLATRKKRNYARIDGKDLPELLRHIEAYQGSVVTRLALKLIALTFVRTSELIGARWSEIDLDAARWDIPACRTHEDENPAYRAA